MKTAFSVILTALAMAGCTSSALHRFPLREPFAKDTDTRPVTIACRPDPDGKPGAGGVKEAACLPEEYESPFMWDGANQLAFRPIARLFAVDPAGESVNVNALDEVPDSAWFSNRIGRTAMTPDDVAKGACDDDVLDPDAADGTWLIDQGKPNGANPGFRVRVEGAGKFMLKADPKEPSQPERMTGAAAIASRLYHAMGYFAPCDSVVHFRPSVLKLKPGLSVTDNSGNTRPFDQAALGRVLDGAAHRGPHVRMSASKWLPGRTIGPFTYEGKRADDPNDVIAHEDRRELRGARVIAAWLNHFDTREQNTMDSWIAADPKRPTSSPGHVRHFYIDLGDCFGSEWDWDSISRRLGHAYYFDFNYVAEDFLTAGLVERPWDRPVRRPPFGYFSARAFDPEAWRGGYPNPAFGRMSERDAAWAARIIARFRNPHVEAAVRVGDFTNVDEHDYLVQVLEERRDAILRRYFRTLSPIADVAVDSAGRLCGTDLARTSGVFPAARYRYTARSFRGTALSAGAVGEMTTTATGVCVSLPHHAKDGGEPEGSLSRYVVVDLENGQAPGVLRAHLYDLGPSSGFRLVGVERPDDARPPR